ncbi:MAG TPA: sugar phosphate isomerase/epimerase family protein [Candidatus Hydrogenedentes bacterium]|jgi:sugar phosphate isomerase/epimerase|nr:sugar phosphate isomerase/epimerase family protein [Candidatus Hydrogenedentota bacterium]HPJ99390.1 sugar phosphate isomerase/epimerase family protein [Candidatus Hydrogenedentota bacterium]
MDTNRLTRREALRSGAALALVPGIATFTTAGQSGAPAQWPKIGVSTLGFGDCSNRELAEEFASKEVRTIQLFFNQTDNQYWAYNGRSDVSDITPDRAKAIANEYRSRGIDIHSIGVYTNLIHPEASERAANLDYFEAMMRIGAEMDVHTFITEAGHYQTQDSVPYHFQTDTWNRTVETVRELAKRAEACNATVLMEPTFLSFFASAKRTRVFLEEVDSPRIRALLDPANILEINDLEEMFAQLSLWIDCIHAKDRKLHVDFGVPAGQGDIDYRKFAALAAKHTPNAPLILEYVGTNDYLQAREVLLNAIRSLGEA